MSAASSGETGNGNAPPRILHLHSTFSLGGKEARAVRLMNDFGAKARHTIVSAMPDQLSARDAIDADVDVAFPDDAPALTGRPTTARMRALADYMKGFDLVLSYNWGALDGVMAHRLAGARGLPPIIHHEDGFNADESEGLKVTRTLYRRLAFRTLYKLVVPSVRLREIAHNVWRQPDERVAHIANGIETARYAETPKPDSLPGFERRTGETVIGTIAGLRTVKDLPLLVRAVAKLPENVRLVIVGEGPERETIEAEADSCGIADHVMLPGFLDRPWRYVGHFDIFALSSMSEQFPISVVEAMAAGLPVVAPDVGDVGKMVAEENRDFIVQRTESDLADALDILASDRDVRAAIGAANRKKAVADFDEIHMIEGYRALYGAALGDPDLFTV